MSGCRLQRLGSGSPVPVCQKLRFVSSDGEDDSIEDVNTSTGGESGFTEIDSPVMMPARRDEDAELWDEDSFGSPDHLRSPDHHRSPGCSSSSSSVIFATCSPSPRKSSRLFGGSPERVYVQDDGEGSSSPIPDCPDTPPHKTFRKLRLFDTPHTPKVSV